MNLIGSLIIGIVLLVGTVAVSRHRCWGWILLIVGDALDVPFAVLTGQWGFVALAVTGAVIAGESWWRWSHPRKPEPKLVKTKVFVQPAARSAAWEVQREKWRPRETAVDWSQDQPERCYFYPGRDCPGWARGGTCQRVGHTIGSDEP